MTKFHRMMLIAGTLVTATVAACAPAPHPAQTQEQATKESLTPLPDLETVEDCQRADLGRYFGRTFRFHLYECRADVSFDDMGRVTSFIPEEEEACRAALRGCGWVD
jgi:hypothetical protein